MGNYITKLNGLFRSQKSGHVNTGEVMMGLAQIMSIPKKHCVKFVVFVCDKGIGPYLDIKERKTFYWDEVLPFLYEKCGEQGLEIISVAIDDFHYVVPTYIIYMMR